MGFSTTPKWLIPAFCTCATLAACEEEGFWIEVGCWDREFAIRDTVAAFNAREGDIIRIEGMCDSDNTLTAGHMNDDKDVVYCHESDDGELGEGVYGVTGFGYGDIHLSAMALQSNEITKCVLMHELGHRILGLEDTDDPDTIMYRYLETDECLTRPWTTGD
jgi:hypothetical protein